MLVSRQPDNVCSWGVDHEESFLGPLEGLVLEGHNDFPLAPDHVSTVRFNFQPRVSRMCVLCSTLPLYICFKACMLPPVPESIFSLKAQMVESS